ncbi:MAG: glycosyltransferase family 4 protein [Steroidobacterales bacterium]
MMQYILPFILAMVVTMASLPLFVRLAHKWLIVDQPGGRKVHAAPIPRIGGLAMACGVMVAALVTIDLQAPDRWLLLAAGVLVLFGALDDRFDLDYRIKLLGQLIAVGIAVFPGGVQLHNIMLTDPIAMPAWLAIPLTAFFLVGITNAINLADGLDGLAGGTTFLCLCAVALLSSIGESGNSTALALAFAGAVLGFLRFNTYPASVFMGDAGSQLLGFAIGVLSVRATQGASSQISTALPVLLLAVPILDTLSVMVQRISEGRSPFSADKNHIHHKLLALGFKHHEAVIVIYAAQAALFVCAYFLRFESDLLILGVVTAFFALAILAFQLATRRGWHLRPGRSAVPDGQHPLVSRLATTPPWLARLSYLTLAIALAIYAGVIAVETASLSRDICALVLGLLALMLGYAVVNRAKPLGFVERGALFVTATILVYLDAVVLPADRTVAIIGSAALAIAALASVLRLSLFSDRRFQLTPLDLIVLFMALVVPSLIGNLSLPHGGALAIGKLVVLFYGVELLMSRSEGRHLWVRIAAVVVLTGLAVRSVAAL